MSSGKLPHTEHPDLFRWSSALDPAAYLRARYRVTSQHDGESTALAMAMEQSAATTHIRGYLEPGSLAAATIRIVAVSESGPASASEVEHFQLETEVYAGGPGHARDYCVELAVPLSLLHGKPAQLFNVVIGELPRLGFLSRFRLEACDLPQGFGTGPSFGITGIRRRFSVERGPLLCRSMRPGVGMDIDTMARLNRDVLVGGFHLVKDDELQAWPDLEAFRAHLVAMLAARDAARAATGEAKGYLANLICEPDELPERWQLACALGVDAALVAPHIQGFGTLATLARKGTLPLLAHNTCGETWNRHPGWGVAPAVFDHWLESLGADWFVTTGGFGARRDGRAKPAIAPTRAMPILQGGKRPDGLGDYRAAVGSDDFMLIVASWVDGHPAGLQGGARVFRDAVDASDP